jgi:hypothetical protein
MKNSPNTTKENQVTSRQLFYWTPEINLLKIVRPCFILGQGLNCYSVSQTSARGLQGLLMTDSFKNN